MHLRFCMLYAHHPATKGNLSEELQELGKKHPQTAMRELGITYQHATPQSMGDCWLFWNCENIPDPLPKFIDILDTDPMKWVGYGLSLENAEKIGAYTGDNE